MIQLEEFIKKHCAPRKLRGFAIILEDKTNSNLCETITSILEGIGTRVTVIDAKTLLYKNDLESQLCVVSEGTLLINNLIDVPDGEQQDIILSELRLCLKGDYLNASEHTEFMEPWMNHFVKTNIRVVAIVNPDSVGTYEYKQVVPAGACAKYTITKEGMM